MSSDLKNCPFCGKQPEAPIDAMRFRGLWTIMHRGCCTLPNLEVTAGSREEVIKRWNRRAPSTAVKALVETVKRAFDARDFSKYMEVEWPAVERALAAVEREIGGA